MIPGAHASDKVELIAVASREQSARSAYASEWDIERAYGSYEALLEDPDVDAVYISLPNTMHREWSIKSLEAGKHVLCEKPFSRAPERRRGGIRRSRARRAPTDGGVHVPPQPADEASSSSSSREGAIGELRVVRSAFSYSLYDAENIRLRTDVEGGSLMDVGCYCVSGSRLLAGEPETVFGQAYIGPTGTDWVFTGAMRFPGDVLALFDCGTCLPERDELEAIGTEGSLFLDDPWHCQEPVIELRRDGEVERIELDPVDSYRLELENLSDAIDGRGAAPARPRGRASPRRGRSRRSHRSAESGECRSRLSLARHLEAPVHRARVRVARRSSTRPPRGRPSTSSVPVPPTSVDSSTPGPGEVEVVDVGLVVDLDRVAPGRERLDRPRRPRSRG